MDDDSRVVDRGWDALPDYREQSGDADDAVTVSISTTPGEWLVNTSDSVVVPMSTVEVVDALRQHKLTLRSLVWRAGMKEWASVDRVPQLRLAARMAPSASAASEASPAPAVTSAPATTTPLGPPPSVVPRAPLMSIPAVEPSRPAAKTTPPPRSSTPAPHALPSRRSTLPFGLPTPSSRPSNPLPATRPAIPPGEGDDAEVLAVYARPAATISFDLAPVEAQRTASPYSANAPQTLAPTTTDANPRPAPRSADLSVVAASHFRDVQRSSKKWIVVSSIGSAAAASLLTFALARRAPEAPIAASPPVAVAAATLAAAARVISPAASASPVASAPEPALVTEPAPSASPPAAAPAPKPKARRKVARVAPPPPRPATDDAAPAVRSPSEEPNPYDVKLEDDVPPSAPSPSYGSGLEAEGQRSDASTEGSTSPGF